VRAIFLSDRRWVSLARWRRVFTKNFVRIENKSGALQRPAKPQEPLELYARDHCRQPGIPFREDASQFQRLVARPGTARCSGDSPALDPDVVLQFQTCRPVGHSGFAALADAQMHQARRPRGEACSPAWATGSRAPRAPRRKRSCAAASNTREWAPRSWRRSLKSSML